MHWVVSHPFIAIEIYHRISLFVGPGVDSDTPPRSTPMCAPESRVKYYLKTINTLINERRTMTCTSLVRWASVKSGLHLISLMTMYALVCRLWPVWPLTIDHWACSPICRPTTAPCQGPPTASAIRRSALQVFRARSDGCCAGRYAYEIHGVLYAFEMSLLLSIGVNISKLQPFWHIRTLFHTLTVHHNSLFRLFEWQQTVSDAAAAACVP